MKRGIAYSSVLIGLAALMMMGCSDAAKSGAQNPKGAFGLVVLEDGTHQFTDEQGNVTRLGEFKKHDSSNSNPDAGVASFSFPATRASDEALLHAVYNSNYFEIWGRKTTIEGNITSTEILVISDTYAASDIDTDYRIIIDRPGMWEFMILTGVRNRTAHPSYYYEYPPVTAPLEHWDAYFSTNATRRSFARPLLLGAAYKKQQIPRGSRTVVPMTFRPAEYTFDPTMDSIETVPCTQPDGGDSPFTWIMSGESQTDFLYPYLSRDGARVRVYPDDPTDFTTLTATDQLGQTNTDSKWPRTITQFWSFIAPPPKASQPTKDLPGKIKVENWYVYAFGNPSESNTAISALMYLGGRDGNGRGLYRNEWTIADSGNPETRKKWSLAYNRTDNTFGAVFQKPILFLANETNGDVYIHAGWEK